MVSGPPANGKEGGKEPKGLLIFSCPLIVRRSHLDTAPNPKSKARRVLKTDIQPPGVSMHGPGGQQTSKKR